MRDDAFGGKVAERLEGVELPAGTAVFDFGTGGLDLAYEVMRGYDALLLVDVSRQGGEPGTLYVMDAEPGRGRADRRRRGRSARTAWTRRRSCASSRRSADGPARSVVIACEPGVVEEMGLGLSASVEEAVGRAVDLVVETVGELQDDAAYEPREEQGDA